VPDRTDIATRLALAIIALAGMAGGYRLGLWTNDEPGAGLFPLLAAASLLLFVGMRAFQGRVATASGAEPAANLRRPAFYVVALLALALPMPYLGFPLAAQIALLIVLLLAERQSPIRSLVISTSMIVATVILFDYGLKVPLPWGPLAGLRFWAP